MKKVLLAGVALSLTQFAQAAAVVDLSDWQTDGSGNWTYDSASNSWHQATNTPGATFLYDPKANSLGKAIGGTIEVGSSGDDDLIGFALGYEAGDFENANADYWLMSWKRGPQNGWSAGLALWHVQGSLAASSLWEPQNHSAMSLVAEGKTLSNTGWTQNTPNTFDITYSESSLSLFVDETLEIAVTAGDAGESQFQDGGFAFFNFSQDNVNYGEVQFDEINNVVTEEQRNELAAEVPVGGLGVLSAFGLMALRRRR